MKMTSRLRFLFDKLVATAASPGVRIDEAPFLAETPLEEINEAAAKGKPITIHGAAAGTGGSKKRSQRWDENYLFSTRRWPIATDNILPAPTHLPAGEHLFFAAPVGGQGNIQGYPNNFAMTPTQTNIETASQVPQGKAFRMTQLGIAFTTQSVTNDIEQILDGGALKYSVQGGQWTMRHGAARLWPGGSGVSGYSTVQNTESAHSGLADPRAVRTLKIPRDIHNLENFNYIYEVGNQGLRASDGTPWVLSKFTEMSVLLWGLQVDRIPD